MIYTIRFPEDAGIKFEMFRYPGGEVQVRLLDNQLASLKKADAVHIWAKIKDGEIVALAQLADAIEMSSVCERILFMPYLPYGRADRAFTDGDCIALRVYQKLLCSLPVDGIYTLDIHNSQARFARQIRNISPQPFIQTAIESIGNNLTILLPDEGAKRYGIDGVYCSKKRDSMTGKLLGFNVPAVGKGPILIIDDICDGGGTFLGIAEKLPGVELYLYVTHGIFSKGFVALGKVFKHIYTTNSFAVKSSDLVTVLPCEGTMLDWVLSRTELWKGVSV